jgi:hypothetical protein
MGGEMISVLKDLHKEESGQDLIEYRGGRDGQHRLQARPRRNALRRACHEATAGPRGLLPSSEKIPSRHAGPISALRSLMTRQQVRQQVQIS